MQIPSICAYCGCGCRLIFETKNNAIVKVHPDPSDGVSKGKPCIKGLTLHEAYNKNRIKSPLIRKNGKLVKVSLDEALKYIYEHIKHLAPEEVAVYGSGKVTNEDNWAALKFARAVLDTSNVDSCCGRLCHAATVDGMMDNYGISNQTTMDNVSNIDVLLLVGSDPSISYPIFYDRLLERRDKLQIISIQPTYNTLPGLHDINLFIEPGTEVVILNAIANALLQDGAYDRAAEQLEGFAEYKDIVQNYTYDLVEEICHTPKQDFKKTVEMLEGKRIGIFHGMGLTQHVNALQNVHALMDLAILTNATILTLRGEVNVQGVGDIGFLPNKLPTGNVDTLSILENYWDVKLNPTEGKNIIEAILINPVKALFISAFNPAQSLPNLKRVWDNLEKMFVVVFESFYSETTKYADVVIPTPLLFERDGTMTNGERRVRLVRKVVDSNTYTEWQVYRKLAKLFGKGRLFDYKEPKDIFKEIVNLVPAYKEINVDAVYSGKDEFADKKIRFKRFYPEHFTGADDIRSKEYPLLLTTIRSKYQFLTGELSRNSETLNKFENEAYVFISKDDAAKYRVKDGDLLKVESEVGQIELKAKISDIVHKGIVATRYHFKETLVNVLFPLKFDKATFTPDYKCVAVRISKKNKI